MAFTLPMMVGGIAAYVQKKTEKLYFFEQTVGMGAGYGIGFARVLVADRAGAITNRSAAGIIIAPALIAGMGLGMGRMMGRLVGDARG